MGMMHKLADQLSATRPDFSWAIRWPDGTTSRYGPGEPESTLVFRNRRAIRRLLHEGSLGCGEAYMDGDLDFEGDMAQLLRFAFSGAFRGRMINWLQKAGFLLRPWRWADGLRRAKKHISHHYDLGNDFFRLWLDESMTYSCAYFSRPGITLEEAQRAKHEHICRKLLIEPDMTLLDIGCGWGELAVHAARHHGARVHGVSLSREQVEWGHERIRREGLEDRVTLEYRDWRTLEEQYDRVVSVGMFEHVGRRNYEDFLQGWHDRLKPGGVSLLHTIGKDVFTQPDPWTMKYIFPGGMVPALHEMLEKSGPAGLVTTDVENLRLHYAMTLEEWQRRFEDQVEEVRAMYDERFVRMWRFFLVTSAVGFRWGDVRLHQVTFTRGTPNDLPLTRKHIYREPDPADVGGEPRKTPTPRNRKQEPATL